MKNGNIISLRNLGSEMAKILTDKVRVRCRILWPTGFEDIPYEIWLFMRPILCIVRLRFTLLDNTILYHTYMYLPGKGKQKGSTCLKCT